MEKKDIKRLKEPISILEIASTDKENLTSKINGKKRGVSKSIKDCGRKSKITIKISKNELQESKGRKNQISKDQTTLPNSVSASDLVTDSPSENYWKNLAESRSNALDSTLKENNYLHNKINELEYENKKLKAMLDEAKALIEVLSEMIEEGEDKVNGNEQNKDVSSHNTNELSSDDNSDDANVKPDF